MKVHPPPGPLLPLCIIIGDAHACSGGPSPDGLSVRTRWLDCVIREYEDGPLGPRHECSEPCDCNSCCKLRWFRDPVCACKIGLLWGRFLSLEDAMRRKWRLCRCKPKPQPRRDPTSICSCILTAPTQEFVIPTEPSSATDEALDNSSATEDDYLGYDLSTSIDSPPDSLLSNGFAD